MDQERFNKLRELSEQVLKMDHFADWEDKANLLGKIADLKIDMLEKEQKEIGELVDKYYSGLKGESRFINEGWDLYKEKH